MVKVAVDPETNLKKLYDVQSISMFLGDWGNLYRFGECKHGPRLRHLGWNWASLPYASLFFHLALYCTVKKLSSECVYIHHNQPFMIMYAAKDYGLAYIK